MIPYKNRFHGHNSISYVYKKGQIVRSQQINMKYIKNTRRKDSRISVVISKKVLKGAVGRNRVRRRIYEYIRNKLPEFNDVYDIAIIVISRELLSNNHSELTNQIDSLFYQSDVIKKPKRAIQKNQ